MNKVNFGTHTIQEQKHLPELQKKEEPFLEKKVPTQILAGSAGGVPVEKKPITFKAGLKSLKDAAMKKIDKFKEKTQITAPETKKIVPPVIEKNKMLAAQFRNEASQIMLSEETFAQKSHKMNDLAKRAAPKSYDELQKLMSQHPDLLAQLKEKGWVGLKNELHEAMAKNDPIRGALVKKVLDLMLETMKVMGYDPPGAHSDYGTPGWNSDIDSPYFADKNVPQALQVTEKLMFDMLVYENFGRLPGFMFDTETYTQQAGGKFETQLQLETVEGQTLFSRIELESSLLQKVIQTGGIKTETWQNFKREQLEAASSYHNDDYQTALVYAFADIEMMQMDIEKGILATMQQENLNPNDPHARQMAMMSYKVARLYRLSAQIDETKQKLDKLTQQNKQEDAMERDILRAKIAQLDVIRTSFYDEGYLTQGAFRTVCFLHEGQIHQRKIEKQQELIHSHYHRQLDKLDAPTEISPWEGGFKLHKTQQMKASALENFSSMSENLAMYLSHFNKKAHGDDAEGWQKALLETSKYGDRVIRAAEQLLKNLEGSSPLDPQSEETISRVKEEIEELSFIFAEQEKVKRSSFLNYSSTEEAMLNALNANPGNIEEIKKKIKPILQASEPGGTIGKAKFEESITPEDRYVTLFTKMLYQGLIKAKGTDKKGLPYSDNHQLDLILKARCGFTAAYDPELYQKLLPYHQGSPKMTLRAQNLVSRGSVVDLHRRLENVTNDVANLVIANGLIHSPLVNVPQEFLFSRTWEAANQESA